MAKRATGNSGLDYILGGGFPENTIQLVVGPPGVGKTILVQSILSSAATTKRKGLYVTTSGEPLNKLIRFVQAFDFFEPDSFGESIFYEQVGDVLRSEGLLSAIDQIIAYVKEYNPAYLVIDSFKAFHNFGATQQEVSRALTKLSFNLSAIAITAFLVGEYAFEEISQLPEFVIADGITELSEKRFGVKVRRFLRIMKMRGTGYLEGEHAFNIDSRGLTIYPRLAAPLTVAYQPDKGKLSTGIEGLDGMLGGGVGRGSSTSVFGPPGAGKTISALHFVFKGIEEGEKGLYVTLTENPIQLFENAGELGWDVRTAVDSHMLDIRYYSPDNVYIDQVSFDILKAIDENGIKRVVIDSMDDLGLSAPPGSAFHDYLYALSQHMAVKQATLWLTCQVEPLSPSSFQTELGASHVSDNGILISFEKVERAVKRNVTVLKTRGQWHEAESHPAEISSSGMTVR